MEPVRLMPAPSGGEAGAGWLRRFLGTPSRDDDRQPTGGARGLDACQATTRLYGQVWTSGPQVVIRYYEAHPPESEKLPICAVARLSRDQMRKLPESKPGMAILEGAAAAAYIVDAFR
jgi:hypothetical protein